MNRYLTFGLLLVCIVGILAQNPRKKPQKVPVPELDDRCLDCICQASSDCNEKLKCFNGAGGGYFCGPYVISWGYWHDGGRPGDKGRAHDFETCLTSRPCAEEAVRGYFRKYGQDCDGNGVIDCYDAALIHKLGFSACTDESIYNTDYYQKFDICYSGYEPNYNDNSGRNVNDGSNINVGSNVNDGSNNGDSAADFVDYGEGHINARLNPQG